MRLAVRTHDPRQRFPWFANALVKERAGFTSLFLLCKSFRLGNNPSCNEPVAPYRRMPHSGAALDYTGKYANSASALHTAIRRWPACARCCLAFHAAGQVPLEDACLAFGKLAGRLSRCAIRAAGRCNALFASAYIGT